MSRSRITQVTLMDAVPISSETKYSNPHSFRICTGSAALIVASTAGTLEISQQCSPDKVSWYDPVDSANSPKGVVAIGQTVTTGIYIVFHPVLAEWIRFKIVESTAATVVTLKLLLREEA